MKINKLKINGFGNLKNKEIELSDKINIIYGKNESGKSTLNKFIVDMFYGISKNKRGKEFSDYDRFKPWDFEEFSGKIEYTLDNNEKYEVFRDFNKKNPIIYNSNAEDISKNFNIDKTNGSEFFIEQTNIDENMFLSSHVSMQQEVVLSTNDQNVLLQKLANIVGTGDDNISYKKAVEKLNKKQLEEIGTSRSQGRPINVVKEELYDLQDEFGELEEYKDKKYEVEENKNRLQDELKRNEENFEYLKELKKIQDEEKQEKEKNNINEQIISENNKSINEFRLNKEKLQSEIEELEREEKKNAKENNVKKGKNKKLQIGFSIFTIVCLIMVILNIFVTKINILTLVFALGAVLGIVAIIFSLLKSKSNGQVNISQNSENISILKEKLSGINSQIELLEKNNETRKEEISKNNERVDLSLSARKNELQNKYKNISLENIARVEEQIERVQNNINNNKLELHRLDLDKENIMPRLEKLASIEERIVELKEQEDVLNKNNDAIELAKEVLEIAYKKMKENVSPKFTESLSQNIDKISNGRYKNIRINDETGIIVEKENGEYIDASKLSVGTIDQLYISLRLAAINEISKEKMPIILDESFAYFDTERLKNILEYLNKEYSSNQIIIFTCTNREKEALNELNIEYNNVEL